jgi:single-strand DNA-binding protein
MSDLIAQVLRSSQHRFIGRIVRDPELRSFDSGNCVANARILINKPGAKRDDGQEPDGFKLEIWGEKAQAFTDATSKGDLVDVTGRVKSETWNDRTTGEQRSGLVVLVEQWALAGPPRQAPPAAAAPAPAAASAAAPQPVWGSTFDLSDSEVPF